LMAKQDTGTELKQDEFSKIFDEYRAKIEEITRRTEKNIHIIDSKPGDNHADDHEQIEVVSAKSQPAATVNNDVQGQLENTLLQKAEPAPKLEAAKREAEANTEALQPLKTEPPLKAEIPPPLKAEPTAKPEPVSARADTVRTPFMESEEILKQARHEAKQIIGEAEESAKKEAKKRTQGQVDKIIEKAKKEAEEITARANKNAEKVRDEVITESKREADLVIREITQKYRQETEAKSSLAMAEAQEKARKMLSDISASTLQVGNHITEIVNKAKRTISELETALQPEIIELSRLITETQNKLEAINKEINKTTDKTTDKTTVKIDIKPTSKTNGKEEKHVPPPALKQTSEARTIQNGIPTLAIRLIGEKTSGNNGTAALFSGQMEMKSASASFDYQYLKKLKKYLVHIPKIKYLQEYASEKEMSVVFDIMEPLPIVDILSNIPMVDEVITRADDDICLVFKTIEV
jgi:hypothetical protein